MYHAMSFGNRTVTNNFTVLYSTYCVNGIGISDNKFLRGNNKAFYLPCYQSRYPDSMLDIKDNNSLSALV